MIDILNSLRDSGKNYTRILKSIAKKENITISEWQLLIKINEEINTQEKLSKNMNLDASTLSRQLKNLFDKKLISKKAIGKDKRQLIYTINEKGNKSFINITKNFDENKNKIFKQWSDEEIRLLEILMNRLNNSLNKI
ncbi:MarR family transcriptional regulator [Lactobacillus sp. S2-2]|uniref:MarR family winged helix-turn-helix transcriptional regulator n=1 Tax=Lactobacillus sp. S2-2 TaxID=2692917 RepID=UPI001F0314E2|nr:MarR family transcriptional regulator [Lactobacillus sp. S2-2]MCF6515054.1 MarR family transcriptional regulator [Lactobacillus sp. S2-2]